MIAAETTAKVSLRWSWEDQSLWFGNYKHGARPELGRPKNVTEALVESGVAKTRSDVAFAVEFEAIRGQFHALYSHPVDKKKVRGIHGTLHLELSPAEASLFPTRRVDGVGP